MGCYKECFDKRGAETVLNECKKEHRKECRIYFCDKCNAWHLTKHEEWEPPTFLHINQLKYKKKWKKLMK